MSVPNQTDGNAFSIGPIFGIPVRFSPWYLLLVLIVFGRAPTPALGMVMLVCFTISVLAHELGHGLAAKFYGLRPAIVIHAFGGWCERAAIPDRRKTIHITAAGPAVNIGLVVLFGALLDAFGGVLARNELAYAFARIMVDINLFWGLFNLLPIPPMDGGRLLEAQLGYRMSHHRAEGITAWIGVFFAAIGVVVAWKVLSSLILVLFLAMMAWQNGQRAAFHPFPDVFRIPPREPPAERGSSGLELPPPVSAMVGALLGTAVAIYLLPDETLPWVVMLPSTILAGRLPWTVLTSPFVHTPDALGVSLLALALFGPPVARALGSTARFWALYVGSLLAGSATALVLAPLLGLGERPVLGAGAGSVALLLAWARHTRPHRRFPRWLHPWVVAGALLAGEVVAVAVGDPDWSWHAHLGGLFLPWLIPPKRLDTPKNVVPLFSQDGPDRWH